MHRWNSRTAMIMAMLSLIPGAAVARAESVQVGQPFPSFEFKEVFSDHKFEMSELKGRIVVFYVWASYQKESETGAKECVNELYKKYRDKGVEFVGLSYDQSRSDLRKYVNSKQYQWPQVYSPGGPGSRAAKDLGLNKVPAVYVIDQEGKVVAEIKPEYDDVLEAIDKQIADAPATSDENFTDKIAQMALDLILKAEPTDDPGDKIWALETLYKRFEGHPISETAKAIFIKERDAYYGKQDMELAASLEKEDKYTDAIKLYLRIERDYKEGEVAEAAAAAAKRLMASDAVQATIQQNQADAKAPSKLRSARNLANLGRTDAAKRRFKEIIEEFPGTSYAEEAQEELRKLE